MRAFRHSPLWMHLALVAIVLLATLPSLGRMLASPQQPALAAPMAMCTPQGLQQAPGPASASPWDAGEDLPPPAGGSGQHHDCDYCPLLASLLLVAACLPAWLAPGIAMPRQRPAHVVLAPRPTGRHARGPPLFA